MFFSFVVEPSPNTTEILTSLTNVTQSTSIKSINTTSINSTVAVNTTTRATTNATATPPVNTTLSPKTTKLIDDHSTAVARRASLIAAVGFIPSLFLLYILCTYVPRWCEKCNKE